MRGPYQSITSTETTDSTRFGTRKTEVLLWRNNDLDYSVRPKAVAIGSVVLGVPVPNAAPQLAQKIETAMLSQMSEIADEVGDGMFVTGAAMLLENGGRFRRPGDMVSFIDQLRHQRLLSVWLYGSLTISLQGIKFFRKLSDELIDQNGGGSGVQLQKRLPETELSRPRPDRRLMNRVSSRGTVVEITDYH